MPPAATPSAHSQPGHVGVPGGATAARCNQLRYCLKITGELNLCRTKNSSKLQADHVCCSAVLRHKFNSRSCADVQVMLQPSSCVHAVQTGGSGAQTSVKHQVFLINACKLTPHLMPISTITQNECSSS
jgi:hypothetical protein